MPILPNTMARTPAITGRQKNCRMPMMRAAVPMPFDGAAPGMPADGAVG